MKKTVAIFIILILFPFYNMYGKQKINFSFLGGLDTYDNWCMTPSFDYFPIPYVSIGAGIRFFDEINSDNIKCGYSWEIDDMSTYAYNLAFQPEVKIYTPAIIKIKDEDATINFSIGAGYLLPIDKGGKGKVDYYNTEDIRQIFTHSEIVRNKIDARKAYPFLDFTCYLNGGRWSLGLGYRISEFDIYGNARQVYVNNQLVDFPKEKLNSEIYLSIHYTLNNNF